MLTVNERWKESVLKKTGLEYITLTEEEWILLLAGADASSPILGEYTFHYIFFLYPFSPFNFKALLITPYSEQLDKCLKRMIEGGILVKEIKGVNTMVTEAYKLSLRGSTAYRNLKNRIYKKHILINDHLVRPVANILNELESLKKTYNGKELLKLLTLTIAKVKSGDLALELHLKEHEIQYLKRIIRYGGV